MHANRGKWLRCSWLAPLMMLGLSACCCPKPEPVNPPALTPAEEAQVNAARDQLKAAEAKGTWTPDDNAKFSAATVDLPEHVRFQLAKDLVGRLNDNKIKVIHNPRGNGPRVCPGICPATRVTTAQPQPGSTDVPGKVVPAAATPTKVVPTPAVGKVPAK